MSPPASQRPHRLPSPGPNCSQKRKWTRLSTPGAPSHLCVRPGLCPSTWASNTAADSVKVAMAPGLNRTRPTSRSHQLTQQPAMPVSTLRAVSMLSCHYLLTHSPPLSSQLSGGPAAAYFHRQDIPVNLDLNRTTRHVVNNRELLPQLTCTCTCFIDHMHLPLTYLQITYFCPLLHHARLFFYRAWSGWHFIERTLHKSCTYFLGHALLR